MSRSDCGGEKAMAVAGSIDDLTADAHAGALPPAGLRAVMSAAIRLYAGRSKRLAWRSRLRIQRFPRPMLWCWLARWCAPRTSLCLIWRCGFPELSQIGVSSGSGSLARANRCWVLMLWFNPTK